MIVLFVVLNLHLFNLQFYCQVAPIYDLWLTSCLIARSNMDDDINQLYKLISCFNSEIKYRQWLQSIIQIDLVFDSEIKSWQWQKSFKYINLHCSAVCDATR